jgi:hypothetical protein
MALFGEHLGGGVLVVVVAAALLVLVSILVWRRYRANHAWEKGMAGPVLRESVQRAICAYRTRLGTWPKGKSEIERLLDVPDETVALAGKWDIRLVTSSRDGRKARYAIFMSGGWTDWDAHSEHSAASRGHHAGRAERDATG